MTGVLQLRSGLARSPGCQWFRRVEDGWVRVDFVERGRRIVRWLRDVLVVVLVGWCGVLGMTGILMVMCWR
jgi:hypothetical protein